MPCLYSTSKVCYGQFHATSPYVYGFSLCFCSFLVCSQHAMESHLISSLSRVRYLLQGARCPAAYFLFTNQINKYVFFLVCFVCITTIRANIDVYRDFIWIGSLNFVVIVVVSRCACYCIRWDLLLSKQRWICQYSTKTIISKCNLRYGQFYSQYECRTMWTWQQILSQVLHFF